MNKFNIRSIGLGICLVAATTSQGQTVIYANNTSLLNPPSGVVLNLVNGVAIGNTITLAPSTPRSLVGLSFEYYAKSSSGTTYSGSPTLSISLYQNNGSLVNGISSPGSTPFYTETFSLNSVMTLLAGGGAGNLNFTNGSGLDFPLLGVPIPANTITWAVQVSGLNAADQFGLVAFDPAAPANVGGGYGQYYWQNNGAWQTYTNSVVGANSFGVEIWAVPEPATISLIVVGGFALLAAAKRRHQN